MLKSTHRLTQAPPTQPNTPLTEGWTEHAAPNGRSYYYHAESKTSTYTRPTAVVPPPTLPPSFPNGLPYAVGSLGPSAPHSDASFSAQHDGYGAPHQPRHRDRRAQPPDRPKSKKSIPGSPPWILVYTKLKKRFIHNPETGESLWKFPQDVMMSVIELDHQERERRERGEREEDVQSKEEGPGGKGSQAQAEIKDGPASASQGPSKADVEAPDANDKDYDSDEYEEVVVTDDEDEGAPKRQKLESDAQGPLEFDEDDIAYQLAAMGQDDEGGGDAYWEEDYAEEEPLNEEDATALFADLLEDFHINPFKPWESLVDEGKIIDDDRYTCLPTMKARKEAWSEWSRAKMQRLREQKLQQEKTDPRIPYLQLLEERATPKLYWPEFKRKFRKEPAMRDAKVGDKEREKWYREYINRLKMPESSLKADLTALLKAQPLATLNRSTSLEALPSALLTDMRYVSVPARVRDPLIEAYIAIQPPAPEADGKDPEDVERYAKDKEERARRERALAEREQRVREQQRRNTAAKRHGREMLREEEGEVQRAMRVGREGLKSHVGGDD